MHLIAILQYAYQSMAVTVDWSMKSIKLMLFIIKMFYIVINAGSWIYSNLTII